MNGEDAPSSQAGSASLHRHPPLLDLQSPAFRMLEKSPSHWFVNLWVVEVPTDAHRMVISADTLCRDKMPDPLILADCFEKVICRVSAKLIHLRRVI